jgi:hypothetical protein
MARKDGKAEVQHYVPQMLLRFHANDPSARKGNEQVWCFDKKTDNVFSPNIKGIVAGSRFYEIEVDGVNLTLEEQLDRLETKVSPILASIVKNRSLTELDIEGREWIAIFAATQFVRTQAFREYVLTANNALTARLREDGIDLSRISNFEVMSEQDVKKLSLWTLTNAHKDFAPYFLNKHWYLMDGRVEDPFHLGDNPVVRENEFVSGQYTMGLASPGISIYLPLCPTLCLGMVDPAVACQMKKAYNLARRMNDQLQKRLKKKSRRLGVDLFVEPMREAAEGRHKLESETRPFFNGTPTAYDHEVVTRINSLQMLHATRWVMSSRNDFSLPKRMIAHDERFRRGLTAEFVRVEIIGDRARQIDSQQ